MPPGYDDVGFLLRALRHVAAHTLHHHQHGSIGAAGAYLSLSTVAPLDLLRVPDI